MIELASCPFCGSDNVTLWNSEREGEPCWCVFCEACEAEGPHSVAEDSATRQWNERHGLPYLHGDVSLLPQRTAHD